MIAWLEGKLLSVKAPTVVLNVNGVGYELEVPMPTIYELPQVGESVSLHVHMVVREDAQLLYGFADIQSRDIFRQLLKISGVGPKVALAILSTFTALMVEMKNRFAEQLSEPTSGGDNTKYSHKQDALDALEALGYKQKDALKGIKGLDVAQMSSEEIIKAALQVLSGRVL